MREIKFRSWAHDSMWVVNGLACSDDADAMDLVDDSIGGYGEVKYYDETESRVLMQYTGIKDRNGTEIYESDIVRYKEIIPSLNQKQREIQGADYVLLDFIGKVTWDDEGASFDIQGEHGYRGFGARGTVEIEVIGNIYETPELLLPKGIVATEQPSETAAV